jgi:hypothetical protein
LSVCRNRPSRRGFIFFHDISSFSCCDVAVARCVWFNLAAKSVFSQET